MHLSRNILIGAGVVVFAASLYSFSGISPAKKGEDEKKKKYHVIHQKDGAMVEYDTIIPMDSEYSVEDFLASKGINDPEVKIIEIPSIPRTALTSEEGQETRVFMHRIDENKTVNDENGQREEVKIIREENENGEVTLKKYVNGQEVEVTEEDLQEMRQHEMHGKNERHVIVTDDAFEWKTDENESNVELKVMMDENGTMKVQKFVDGEEVEVSEEEMKKFENGDRNIFIINEESSGELDAEMDSLLKTIEMKVEMIDDGTLEEGEQRIIIKEIEFNNEETQGDSKEVRKEVRMHKTIEVDSDESEDFTIVLVHENYDESMEEHMEMRIIAEDDERVVEERSLAMNEPISVYPNPNKGTFTIAFNQKEKVKTAIRVVDAQGKVVFKEKLGTFSGNYKKELDLQKHGNGVYIVTVEQGDEVSSRKVIVE